MKAGAGQGLALHLAALLSGAAGLGLELLAISLSGPLLGHGRASALGIALFVAGWAAGARWSARFLRPEPWLAAAGALVALGALAGPRLLLLSAAASPPPALCLALTALVIGGLALPQGFCLPLLARRLRPGRLGLAPLIAANLLGAALGAELFGQRLPAGRGLLVASAAAGGLALVAGGLGALAAWRARPEVLGEERASAPRPLAPGRLSDRAAGLWLALFVGWAASVELVALRLGVLWLGGMQPALGAVLLTSLLALAAGSALLPALLPRGARGLALLLALCIAAPLFAFAPGLGIGALPASSPLELRAAALVAPLLLPFGAALPLLHRELARRDERSLGRLLGWEALGALLGMPLTYGLLALGLGLGGVIGVWSALATAAAAASALSLGRAMLGPVALGAVASALVLGPWLPPPARSSPPLSNPALRILAFAEDEHFAVSVVDDGISGERTLLTDGFRAAGTGPDYAYMRALGHLPLLLHPAPRRVCVLAFGTGTTAGAVALHPEVEAILILELSRAVIGVAPWFAAVHGGVLASERVRLVTGDGRRALAEREGAFDLLTMEPLLPNSPFGVYLYTREFYERARRALAPGGLLCQWVPPHALDPESFAAVIDGFARAFAWSGLFLSGTQLLLLGGEREPELSAERFPSAESALARALAEIGLERPAGVLARYLGPGESFGPAPRPLSDADPWIVHRPPPRGARSLSWLPRNLAAMREREEDPPRSWRSGLDAAGRDRVEGMAAARRVREALAVRAAEMAGLLLEDPRLLRELDLHLSDALQRAWEDAGVRALALEAEFTIARQRGLLALSALPGAEGGRASVGDLLRAAELRPGRGDVHLHLAVALERIGELEGARHALERALELCPGLARTPAWEQARRLGFPATRELAWVSGG